ncbi:uncharacterized protein BDV14DRAFT_200750 [Aspergillus stella-maris]|uniref:uncharacterized protein n=1 Tax=Aspergillus stella-maris TaxID=1810926 RepID=UPI003CCE43AC
MPITTSFPLPPTPESLLLPTTAIATAEERFVISFHASIDPGTKKPWCPDVGAAIPHLTEVFSTPDAPTVAFVEVGLRAEWKEPTNTFRTKWDIAYVPTLVRFEGDGGDGKGKVKETGRLVEGEILDRRKLREFVFGREEAKV